MPNQSSSPKAFRATVVFVAAALLLVCTSSIAHAALQGAPADDWSNFWTYGLTIILTLVLIGLIVYKRLCSAREIRELAASKPSPADPALLDDPCSQSIERAQVSEKPQPVDAEPSVFGAYRIDQEVGKLALGKPHRMDVMASRAAEDRRAIEASLVRVLDSSDFGEDDRQRARQALEKYGFVARQSALVLMGRDAWERSSAARVLGQIGSQSSLTFLIEALHDPDSVVRNQAVFSLGELKVPAAIGALLDIARRHPDIPASLLSESLSACSVESLGYLDALSSKPAMRGDGSSNAAPPELESFMSFEDLPSGNETRR